MVVVAFGRATAAGRCAIGSVLEKTEKDLVLFVTLRNWIEFVEVKLIKYIIKCVLNKYV